MARSVGIVVPAYDPDVDRLTAYVEALRSLDPATIRIELDAASDAVRDALAGIDATVNAVPERRGKGAAVTAGFEALETDVYAFVDADGSTPVESVHEVLAPVVDGEADLAAGSRRHPDSVVEHSQSHVREALGDAFAWLARQTLSVALYDYQCGAKAITAEAWARVRTEIYDPGFAWDVDLVAAAGRNGLRVREVPIRWIDRPRSTVSPAGDGADLIRALVRAQRIRLFDGTTARPLLEEAWP